MKLTIYKGGVKMIDLKSRRLELGLTLEEVGDLVGVGKSTVRKWENGMIDNMKRDKIALLAKALRISPLQLVVDGYNGSETSDILSVYNQLESNRKRTVYNFAEHQLDEQNHVDEESTVYLYGQTAAGAPIAYGDINYDVVSGDIPKDADGALFVNGDSMEPLIENGSIIFYKKQPVVENGEVAVVELNGSEVTCKKFYFNGRDVILRSINENYKDLIINEGVRVIGKVIL